VLRSTLIRAGASPALRRQVSANPLAARVAGRFIAGDTLDEAATAVEALNRRGITAALDFLGENTTARHEAAQASASYLAALDRIAERELDANISVKLSALGLHLGGDVAVEEATRLLTRADEIGVMVGVDMESHVDVDPTLAAIGTLRSRAGTRGLGVCLQAYLYRTPGDLEQLNRWGVPVRLVKGAYDEPASVAHPEKRAVDRAYAELLDPLMAANPYPMIATHDPGLIVRAKRLAHAAGRERGSFEFQFLYGIGRDLQQELVAQGYRVRVYVPYGTQWLPYFTRRLAERPANLSFFLSSLTRR
jgi:proline dehydrogenase